MQSDAVKSIITMIRNELNRNVDDKTRETSQNFFKEPVNPYGVKTATVTMIGKTIYKAIEIKEKALIFQICEELWKSGRLEESFIACHFSYYIRKSYSSDDIFVFERWIENYVSNWASCDTLCNHTMGEYLVMFPEHLTYLRKWTQSENRWMRRAAAVSLIIPGRNGIFHPEIFAIADCLLTDPDDLVQKGYGWMLKSASMADQESVFKFVMERKTMMPRTALRYAIEKMPQNQRKKAMEKA